MAVPTNCGCNTSTPLPPSQCKELVSMACVCGLLDTLDKKQNTIVVDPSQITVWNPLEYYVAPNKYVTYVNPSSSNPQFQKEIIYRCDKNTVPGESPESTPEKWIAEGTNGYGSIAITDVIGLRSELDNIESEIAGIPTESLNTELLNASTTNSSTYVSPRKIWVWWNYILGLWNTFKINYLQFNTSPTLPSTLLQGLTYWDSNNNCISTVLDVPNNVILQNGQEVLLRVKNSSGATLLNGTVVYITDANGDNILVDKAVASNDSALSTIGMLTCDIPNNSSGWMTLIGKVNDLNTNAFEEGNSIYLSTTAGQFTNIKPSEPNYVIELGKVTKKSGESGSVVIHVDKTLQEASVTSVQNKNTTLSNYFVSPRRLFNFFNNFKITVWGTPTDDTVPSSKLVNDTFNAITLGQAVTVGTGGQYATISAAVAAGKYNLIVISNITETSNITFSLLNTYITGYNKYTINFGSYYMYATDTSHNVWFNNLEIITVNPSYLTGGRYCLSYNVYVNYYRSIIRNNSTADHYYIAQNNISIDNGIVYLPNHAGCFTLEGAQCTFNSVEIVGGGSGCEWLTEWSFSGFYTYHKFKDIRLTGTFGSNPTFRGLRGGDINGIVSNLPIRLIFQEGSTTAINISNMLIPNGYFGSSYDNCVLSNFEFSDFRDFAGNGCLFSNGYITYTTITLNTDSNVFNTVKFAGSVTTSGNSIKFSNCTFGVSGDNRTIILSGNNIVLEGCTIFGNLVISGNFNKVSNCYIGSTASGTKTITINSGATKNSILNCTTEVAIVDNGTGTNILISNTF